MLRLAVLVSGGGTNLQALLDQMDMGKLPGVSIEVVISSKEKAYALERARAHGIATAVIKKKDYNTPDQFDQAFYSLLTDHQVDLIVLAGFLLILPLNIVRHYKNRIINVHPSLIPAFCGMGYYGLKVHEEVLSRGVKLTGATVHFVDEGTDTGPIILQKAVPVLDGDSPEILQKRVMEEAEWTILPEAVRLISENRVRVEGNSVIIM
ncbi:MAG: phosphoribosylglycinamide formyltransferase [Clostridiales bacterium]|jgi:phosphoribosylglycinamide formyltransferase-1|nr:phosphoribosylglycinamide formyltransferase [Clostridiales bacterium]